MPDPTTILDDLFKMLQERKSSTSVEYISERSETASEFAAAIMTARYLGISLKGQVPKWVNRFQNYPESQNLRQLSEIKRHLAKHNLTIGPDGEIVILNARRLSLPLK